VVEASTAKIERKFTHLTEDSPVYEIETEVKIEMEIKARKNYGTHKDLFRN
jgi:hypothetical protein